MPKSREAYIEEVSAAVEALPQLVAEAIEIEKSGADMTEIHAAWERVETAGATVHRRTRLLAGKKRGG